MRLGIGELLLEMELLAKMNFQTKVIFTPDTLHCSS